MGYTHYWYRAPEIDPKAYADFIVDATHIVLEASKRGIRLGNGAGHAFPKVGLDAVELNGKGDESYESFIFPRTQPKPDWQEKSSPLVFEFCKTAHRPYDAVVTALLLAARETMDVDISSDGEASEWQAGMDLYTAATGKAPPSVANLQAYFAREGLMPTTRTRPARWTDIGIPPTARIPTNSGCSYDMVRERYSVTINGEILHLIVYGAFNAYGLIGSECNGIAVLNDTQSLVVLDEHAKADSGFYGTTDTQRRALDGLLQLSPTAFVAWAKGHARYRQGSLR